jgi:hypothetical protein
MANRTRRAVTGRGWRQTAPLIPLALLATAFGIQAAADDPAVANSAIGDPAAGNGVVVPSTPIDSPANFPIPGLVANGVPRDAQSTQVVSGLSRNGIPQAALQAYSRAQQVMSKVDPGCNLPWTLVAAIGRVESNHGRHGGNVLNADGVAVPGIFGPQLNGIGTAEISDSDGGSLDGDVNFDRAVGPMQFIPGTWRVTGVDGDGDGTRNPQDIDDAAMSTAVYLCAGDTNLAEPGDLNAAILRYNHSQSYVDLVIRIAEAYARGAWTAVENGRPEDVNQGIDTGRSDVSQADVIAPTDPLGYPMQQPETRTSGRPQRNDPSPPTATSRPSTQQPGTSEPSSPSTSTPPVPPPTSKPPASPPSVPDPVATVQTAIGTITGTAGTTVAELQHAVSYCQQRMTGSGIPTAQQTQQRLQDCTNAYLTGGARAADQVIRNLLSLLGLPGVLGG